MHVSNDISTNFYSGRLYSLKCFLLQAYTKKRKIDSQCPDPRIILIMDTDVCSSFRRGALYIHCHMPINSVCVNMLKRSQAHYRWIAISCGQVPVFTTYRIKYMASPGSSPYGSPIKMKVK